jgi:hypothetical protein
MRLVSTETRTVQVEKKPLACSVATIDPSPMTATAFREKLRRTFKPINVHIRPEDGYVEVTLNSFKLAKMYLAGRYPEFAAILPN